MLIKSKKVEYVPNQAQKQTGFVQADYLPVDGGKGDEVSDRSAIAARGRSREDLGQKVREAEQAAYERGLAEGMIRGSDVEKKRLLNTLKSFEKALQELSRLKATVIERQEEEILGLVLMIAEKVLHREIETDRAAYVSVLREAVRNILDKEGMKIRLSTEDYDHLIEVHPDFLTSFEGVRNPSFDRDESLVRGDVVIETMFGEVDARLERQFGEIASVLLHKG